MHSLSLPTWVIHISSVIEWSIAIWLIWTYNKQHCDRGWGGLAWAMFPALVSAMCACTWHFFDNADSLEWLVTVQAFLTLLGNCTLAIAGYRIWKISLQKSKSTWFNLLQVDKISRLHACFCSNLDKLRWLKKSFTAVFEQTRHKKGRMAKPRNGFYILILWRVWKQIAVASSIEVHAAKSTILFGSFWYLRTW